MGFQSFSSYIKSRKLLASQAGQAVIEYIFLVFISILIIGGVVYQINDAFRQYMNALFAANESGYLFCLIQNGYLPGESEVCNFPTLDVRKGKPLFSNGIGGVGANGKGAGAGAHGGAGAGSGVGGGGRLSDGSGRGLAPYTGAAGSSGSGSGGQSGKQASGPTGNNGFSSAPVMGGAGSEMASTRARYRSRRVPYNEDADLGGVKANETVPASDRDLQNPRTVAAEKRRQKELARDTDTTFSFGNILKFVIILLIVFSLIFFVGSQIVAISQGSKKRS